MKYFSQYLQEAVRVYEFSIKLAGCEFDKSMQDKLKTALEIYAVESMGKAKRLPIQEHTDFPGMGACECYMVEVAVRYPTISDQIAQIVSESLGISRKAVTVRTLREEELSHVFYEPKKSKDGSVLNNPELESDSNAQKLVGDQRRESMLKELVTRKYELADKGETAKSDPMDVSTTSPVGSKQNKIPDPTKQGK